MTWLFFFKRSKCFPYCGTLNGCRKCCHSTLLSKLPEWGFGSGRCQCGRFQRRTDPAQVSSRWERDFRSLRPLLIQMNTVISPLAVHSAHFTSRGNVFARLEVRLDISFWALHPTKLTQRHLSVVDQTHISYCKQIFRLLSTNMHKTKAVDDVWAERWTEAVKKEQLENTNTCTDTVKSKRNRKQMRGVNIIRWRRKTNCADFTCYIQTGDIVGACGVLGWAYQRCWRSYKQHLKVTGISVKNEPLATP